MTPEEDIRDPALSRLYREHSQGEPPPGLDAAILARARQATITRVRKTNWWRRFSAPLALTATVVLAVMLTLTMNRHPPEPQPPALAEEQPPAPVETRQATPPSSVVAEKPAAKAEAKVAAPEAKAKPVTSAGMEESRPATIAGKKGVAAPRPAPFPAESSPPGKPAGSLVEPSAPEGSLTGGAATASPAMGDKARAVRADRAGMIPAEPSAKTRSEESQSVGTALVMPKSAVAKPTSEAWIEEIRKLRREGRKAEAEQSLKEFRRAYPDYDLPRDLR